MSQTGIFNNGGVRGLFYTANSNKNVADPLDKYISVRPLWDRARAIIGGQRFAKQFDTYIDTVNFSNLLLPFSPSMSPQQYDFYKAEAELPGFTSQYARTVVGSLLRKGVSLELPEDAPEDAHEWIMRHFTSDNNSILHFLDHALWEEIQTSRCWVYVDYPQVDGELDFETQRALQPYPTVIRPESVVNWRTGPHPTTGEDTLLLWITRAYLTDFSENEFHPNYIDTAVVHEITNEGYLRIRVFERNTDEENVPIINGEIQQYYDVIGGGYEASANGNFTEVRTIDNLYMNGERMSFIPAFPLNGSIETVEPMLQPLIDREVGLYNKVSRRNHLLYGAATYTPVVSSDMTDEEFDALVSSGLGSWLRVREGESITALETPTGALADMETSISNTIEEMARMGIRLLNPEGNNNTSGVALEIRNAAQTGQLGHLNTRVSDTMAQIITLMINWRYGTEYDDGDIKFMLSGDFNPAPLGSDWMRMITEWYQGGLIPRKLWLEISKQNDLIPNEYEDTEGLAEIEEDPRIVPVREQYDREQEVADRDFEAAYGSDNGTGPGSGSNPSTSSASGQKGLSANKPTRERTKSVDDGRISPER